MKNIRQAEIYEAGILTDIAIRSEAYWGYDKKFMESFASSYKVTEEFIKSNPTYVLVESETIIGFYGVIIRDNETELEYLYIEPKYIGKGYGKMLWDHMIANIESLDIKEVVFVTSPQAKGFYIKMGAILCEEVESLVIKGRKVPKLVYRIR